MNHPTEPRSCQAPAQAAWPRHVAARRAAVAWSARTIRPADAAPAPTDVAGTRPARSQRAMRAGSWLEPALLLLLACYPLALFTAALLRGR